MPDSEETRSLLDRVRGGDRDALDTLFARHRPYLEHVIGMRLGARLRRRIGVSDVVQATQLDALERIDHYLAAAPVSFRCWLRRAAHHRLHRVLEENLDAAKRDVRREVALPERSSLDIAAQLADRGSSPSERAARSELAERVRAAFAQLADADREILLMRTVEGMAYEEIGYVLQIEPAAARKRRGRALLRLDRILREEGLKESSP